MPGPGEIGDGVSFTVAVVQISFTIFLVGKVQPVKIPILEASIGLIGHKK